MLGTTSTPTKRTPEQRLALAQNSAQRAKGQIRHEQKRRAAARCKVVGRQLIAASARDPEAKALLDRLVAGLRSPKDRALFEPLPVRVGASKPPLDAATLFQMISQAVEDRLAAKDRGDMAAAKIHSALAADRVVAWETVTQQLFEGRPRSWEPVPGSRRRLDA